MRALFIGLGGVGQRHLRNLLALVPGAEIAAVRHIGRRFEIDDDLKANVTVDVVDKYGIRILRDLEEGVRFRPALAIVANPSRLHADTARFLVEHAIPVFLEKPAATDRSGFDALLAAADRYGVPVMVGYQLRWHPCVVRLAELLAERRVGLITSGEVVVHSFLPSWHSYEAPNAFYAGQRALGGGAVLTEIHEIDLLCRFFGLPRLAFAVGGTLGNCDIDVEDTYGAVMEFEESHGRRFPVTLSVSFIQNPPARRVAVHGTAGKVVLDIPRQIVDIVDPSGATASERAPAASDRNRLFRDELAHFLECVATGDEPLTSLRRIRNGQLAALAIADALRTGQPQCP